MIKKSVGILHPGAMGVSIAATVKNSGHDVYWASEGRSPQTHERAAKADLEDVHSLAQLCKKCSIILSVCPPHAAEDVAEQVLSHSFTGLYLDANAISPQRVKRLGHSLAETGVSFVDGGIIGGPAWEPGRTWLYLSGERAEALMPLFAAGPLETAVIGDEVGKASALKMCYAAYTKGTTALLCAIIATADTLDVWPELEQQWSRDWPDFAEQAVQRVRKVTAKAWRFAGEMEEIAATFREAGLPGDFHGAASELYSRIADFKDAPSTPQLEDVLAALVQSDEAS